MPKKSHQKDPSRPDDSTKPPWHPVFGRYTPPTDKSKNVSRVGEPLLERLTSHKLRAIRLDPASLPSQRSAVEKILTQRAINLGQDPFLFIRGGQ